MSPSAACIHVDPRNSRIFEVHPNKNTWGLGCRAKYQRPQVDLNPALGLNPATLGCSWTCHERHDQFHKGTPGASTGRLRGFVGALGNGWKGSPASWCLTSFDNPNRFLAWNPLLSPHLVPTWTLCFSISCWDVSQFVLVKSCKIRPHRTLASPPSLLVSGSLSKPLKWCSKMGSRWFQMFPAQSLAVLDMFKIRLNLHGPKPRLPDSHPQPQRVKRPGPSRNAFAPTWSAPRRHANQWF